MFPLNTILAWNINIIMNKKYDNNNIIIVSRAYFLHVEQKFILQVPGRTKDIFLKESKLGRKCEFVRFRNLQKLKA
jgi:hypothetical protein